MAGLYFSVDSALLQELGEKLVESVHLALVELVKNAYDADATSVVVRFKKNSSGGPTIQIEDDGTGMTFKEVQKYWMRIATTNKVDSKFSSLFGRPKTGAKGLGRFSCRRLGAHLTLETTARTSDGRYETTKVEFPWKDFVPGEEVTTIKCEGEVSHKSDGRTGTKLSISDSARDEWVTRGFEYVKRQLGQLTANRGARRPHFQEDTGFNISIEAEGTTFSTKDLRQELIHAGWGTLSGKIDKTGKVTYTLNALDLRKAEIHGSGLFPELAGLSFQIGIFPIRKEQWRDPKILSMQSVSTMLDDWGGIQIRQNGFRVYPYGDDDWLDIDKDKALSKGAALGNLIAVAQGLGLQPNRVMLNMLSMRAYLGNVEIIGNPQGLEPKANREGFLASPALAALKSIVRFGIDWASIYRAYSVEVKETNAELEARNDFLDSAPGSAAIEQRLDGALKYLQVEVKAVAKDLSGEKRAGLLRALEATKDLVENFKKGSQEQLKQLRLAASTTTILPLAEAEVQNLFTRVGAAKAELHKQTKRNGKLDLEKALTELDEILSERSGIERLFGLVKILGANNSTVVESILPMLPVLGKVAKAFEPIFEKYGIGLELSVADSNLGLGPMIESELYVLFINSLSNSLKSCIASGLNARATKVTAFVEEGFARILIQDNGIKLKERYFGEVMNPFVIDPERNFYPGLERNLKPGDRETLGQGSGLGLSISREIARLRGGELAFQKPAQPWTNQIELALPAKRLK